MGPCLLEHSDCKKKSLEIIFTMIVKYWTKFKNDLLLEGKNCVKPSLIDITIVAEIKIGLCAGPQLL